MSHMKVSVFLVCVVKLILCPTIKYWLATPLIIEKKVVKHTLVNIENPYFSPAISMTQIRGEYPLFIYYWAGSSADAPRNKRIYKDLQVLASYNELINESIIM